MWPGRSPPPTTRRAGRRGTPPGPPTSRPAEGAGPSTAASDAQGGQAGHAAGTPDGLNLLPLAARPEEPGEERADLVPSGRPAALHVEMQPPPPSVARSLRLSAGQPAAMVTVRFDDLKAGRAVALNVR